MPPESLRSKRRIAAAGDLSAGSDKRGDPACIARLTEQQTPSQHQDRGVFVNPRAQLAGLALGQAPVLIGAVMAAVDVFPGRYLTVGLTVSVAARAAPLVPFRPCGGCAFSGAGCIAMPAGATMMQATQRHQPHHRCIRYGRSMKPQVTAAARRAGRPTAPQGRMLHRRQRAFTRPAE